MLSQEVVEIVRRMDSGKIENQLVLQCAPLIVGLKISNLFIIQKEHLFRIHELLEDSTISSYVLFVTEEKSTVLLYDRSKLKAYLLKRPMREFLMGAGYQKFELEEILSVFQHRYEQYRLGKREFPHELGVLLGYPLEDVEGFICNGGKNFLYKGYWKVYKNVPAKKDLFRMYELAKETLMQLVLNGIGIAEIIDVYRGNLSPKNFPIKTKDK